MALTAAAAHARAEATYRPRANRVGLWLFIISESFLFAAVISSRYVLVELDRPDELNQGLALALTSVLLASSITAYLAETAIAHDDRRAFGRFIWATVGLGVLFLGGVALEWNEAVTHFPPETAYGSVFLTLIGLHAFHVLTGVVALVIVARLGAAGHFGSHDSWPVEGPVKYWHFVDLAWVAIYPTLYLVS